MQSRLFFRLMSAEFRLRDLLRPPEKILKEAGLRPGMIVLDFGCGPGGFSLAAARLVGPAGRVYALDIHPLAIRSVERKAARRGFANVTVVEGRMGRFGDATFDAVFLYDVLHDLADPVAVLSEIRRVLKRDGFLSLRDHHWKGQMINKAVVSGGLFRAAGPLRSSYRFEPNKGKEASK